MIRTTFCPPPPPASSLWGTLLTPCSVLHAPAPSMATPAVPAPAAFRKSRLVNLRRRARPLSCCSKFWQRTRNARAHARISEGAPRKGPETTRGGPGYARPLKKAGRHGTRPGGQGTSSSHGLLEREQEFLGAGRVPGELLAGEGRVQELAVAGDGAGLRGLEVAKPHRPVRELPPLREVLAEGDLTPVPRVVPDLVVERPDGLLLSFDYLHEIAVFVEEHPRDPRPRVVVAARRQKVLQLRPRKRPDGGAHVNEKEQVGLQQNACTTRRQRTVTPRAG